MSFQHEYPYGDVHEMNLDWLIQTMQEFINSERAAGNTPTVASVRSFFTHKYPYGDIHELNLDWVIQTALRMEEIGDSVEGDIGELQTRMTAAEGNISTLDNTVSGLSDSVDQIETEIGNINDDVGALETTSAQHTAQIAALDDKIDTQVVANPAGAATDTLNKIEIAGAVYGVEGSGGSEVEANPTGEPTDTLKKIGIDGTIYEVGGSEPVSKTVTGNPIHIEDAADAPIVSGTVAFEPVQDLHGYDKPWAGGAGKNKLANVLSELKINNTLGTWSGNVYTINECTIEILTDNADNILGYKVNGSFTGTVSFVLGGTSYKLLSDFANNSNFVISQEVEGSGANGFVLQRQESGPNIYILNNHTSVNIDPSSDITNHYRPILRFNNGDNIANKTYVLMIRLATETDPTFEPYSNICPIEGYTDCELEVTDDATSPTVTNTYTIDLDGTRYGGTVNPVSGVMRVDRVCKRLTTAYHISETYPGSIIYNIYNPEVSDADFTKPIMCNTLEYVGNTVSSRWKYGTCINANLSSFNLWVKNSAFEDVYEATDWLQNNPTEICYELATPFTVQLTPEQIRTLEGTNNISTNMTGMSLEYITQDYQPLVKLIERSVGHHYSEQERVVGSWFGKPLYEKSWDVSIEIPSASANTWLSTGILTASVNCDTVVGGKLVDNSNQFILGNIGFIQQNTYFAINVPIGNRTITAVTIQYTKTTD